MCLFTNEGYQGENSPDRTDALVWAMTDLFKGIIHHKEPEKAAAPRRRDYRDRDDDRNEASFKVL